jgi:hypothetical protein
MGNMCNSIYNAYTEPGSVMQVQAKERLSFRIHGIAACQRLFKTVVLMKRRSGWYCVSSIITAVM